MLERTSIATRTVQINQGAVQLPDQSPALQINFSHYDRTQIESAGGMTRRDVLPLLPLVPTALLSACGKRKKSPSVDESSAVDPRLELARLNKMLQQYVARQKVVDLSGIDAVVVWEMLEADPSLGGRFNAKEVLTALSTHPEEHMGALLGPVNIQFVDEKMSRVEKVTMPFKIVAIRAFRVRMMEGSRADRIIFDSTLVHEVNGHGVDGQPDSKFSKFLKDLYLASARNVGIYKDMYKETRWLQELKAYLKETDWLIRYHNLDKRNDVLGKAQQEQYRRNIAKDLMPLMRKFFVGKAPKGQDKLWRLFITYTRETLNAASPRARAYYRKILRDYGWKGPLPF